MRIHTRVSSDIFDANTKIITFAFPEDTVVSVEDFVATDQDEIVANTRRRRKIEADKY